MRISPFPSSLLRIVPGKESNIHPQLLQVIYARTKFLVLYSAFQALGKVSFISAATKMQFCDFFLNLLASTLQRSRASASSYQITGIFGWTGHMATFFGKAEICASIY